MSTAPSLRSDDDSIIHPSGLPLPRVDYNDADAVRKVTDGLRDLAVSLDGRELRLRRGDPVSPLGAGFVAGPDEDSEELGSEFEDPDEDIEEEPPSNSRQKISSGHSHQRLLILDSHGFDTVLFQQSFIP